MRVTIADLKEMKQKGEKISMITAYDYTSAKLFEEVGIPIMLVGDSLGMVVLGYDTTIPVTIEDMLHHTKAVVRGTKRSLIVGDMPFMTYHTSVADALRNAARFIQEAGAQAVKLEGGVNVAETVRRIVNCGIPVQGHIGLTPQSANQLGGHKIQGKSVSAALSIIEDAKALDDAGVFSIVLEGIPAPLSKIITDQVSVPTIGIAAGPHCDGQVQVVHDVLGLYTDFVPRHAKQYAKVADVMREAISSYKSEVEAGTFPTPKHSVAMNADILAEIEAELASRERNIAGPATLN